MKKIIIDTDPGVDDAMALLYADACPDLDLLGMTTVFGNASISQVTRNAAFLKQKFGMKAAIVKGAEAPLKGAPPDPVTFIHGYDGLGDAEQTGAVEMQQTEGLSAAEYLYCMAREHPGEITLIALGPLTNLAQAVTQFPDLTELVAEVVVMGGAFGFNGETGNMTPVAEANFYNDPQAADIVVRNHWPLTVVGLDVTHQTLITPKDLEEIRKKSIKYGSFIYDISQIYMAFYREKFGMSGFSIHDPSAVIYASNPDLFDVKRGYLRVIPEGIGKGQSILVPAERAFLINEWADGKVNNVCQQVKEDALLRQFIETLSR